jgi:isoleucyl-tRNA synthetase
LSNWYVRRCRERFWQKEMNQDKINAYLTLYNVLMTLDKLIAPFVPFMAEEIYQNLSVGLGEKRAESVHFCDYPVVCEEFIDNELEKNMQLVLDIVVLGRACRNTANIKNRQPIGKMYVKSEFELPDMFKELVIDELNVKEIVFIENADSFTSYKFKPQLKTLGPKYGKMLPKIAESLSGLDGNETMSAFRKGQTVKFAVEGQEIELLAEDVLIEVTQKPGFVSETDRNITVVLDINLTEELIEEGFVREIISKIQTMRKEAGFEVQDHISLFYSENARIAEIINKNSGLIAEEVLAERLIEGSGGEYSKEWSINGENVKLSVQKFG